MRYVLLLTAFLLIPTAGSLLAGQSGPPAAESPVVQEFRLQQKVTRLSPLEMIRQFDSAPDPVYRLGAGDEITVDVWNRPELTGKHVVGPDGRITLPLAGAVKVAELTRDEAPAAIVEALSPYYANPVVTLRVDRYVSNRIYILGRVHSPGALQFESQPTLLDVITRAGALPIGGVGADKAALSRCAIFRGRDQVLWVELRQILSEGNLAYNIRLRRDDIVYLPDSDDQLVYVLGEVQHPGAFQLTPSMTFMDALAQSGGPTQNGSRTTIHLVRARDKISREIDLKAVLSLNEDPSVQLKEGDIVYVPKSRMGKFGYVMEKLGPLTGFAIFGSVLK